jgi:hypothetical protein
MKNILTLTMSCVPRAQGEDSQDTVNPVWVTLLQVEKNSSIPKPRDITTKRLARG